ncbi:MAG: hypothetical protein HY774_22730 [Acidobacteria bacterium]|nr:hypothetical protein [Acidobacteriota bacterium]
MVHIRFEGRSYDFQPQAANIRPTTADADVLRRVATLLNVAPERLKNYVVDRTANGTVIIRPEAVYG